MIKITLKKRLTVNHNDYDSKAHTHVGYDFMGDSNCINFN